MGVTRAVGFSSCTRGAVRIADRIAAMLAMERRVER